LMLGDEMLFNSKHPAMIHEFQKNKEIFGICGIVKVSDRNQIYDYIKYTPIHHERKEKELPDLIQCAIDDAMTIKAFMICDKYTNINTHEDVKMAEDFFS
jgi:hypothetical protein